MLTQEALDAAYQLGFEARPNAVNPYPYHRSALRAQWDYGQHAAFLKRITEPDPTQFKLLRAAIIIAGALIIVVSARKLLL